MSVERFPINTRRHSEMQIRFLRHTPRVLVDGKPSRFGERYEHPYISIGSDGITMSWGSSREDYRAHELILDPPVYISFQLSGFVKRFFDQTSRIVFKDDAIEVTYSEEAERREGIANFISTIESLKEQEQQLQQDLSQQQARVQQLEQQKAAEEQHLNALLNAKSLREQRTKEIQETHGDLQQLQTQISQLDTDLASANAQAEELRKAVSDKMQEQQLLQEQNNAALAEEISNHTARLSTAKGQYDSLLKEKERLAAECKQYSPDALAKLEAEISTLDDQRKNGEERWKILNAAKDAATQNVAYQRKANESLLHEIEMLPQELRELQMSHEQLSRRLNETIHAQEMCSEEKQALLRQQIEEQEPIAIKLKEQHSALQQQAEKLDLVVAEATSAKDQALLNLWPRLTAIIADVKQNIGDMDGELTQLQETATKFNQQVKSCSDRLDNLREWYRVDQTPLQKLLDRIDHLTPNEHEELLRTMDFENADRVRELFSTAENCLKELDALMKDVSSAASHDEKYANLRATTNEEYAKKEMRKQS